MMTAFLKTYSRKMALNQFQKSLTLTHQFAGPIMDLMPVLSKDYGELKEFFLVNFGYHKAFGKMLLDHKGQISRKSSLGEHVVDHRGMLAQARHLISRGDYSTGYRKLQKIFDLGMDMEVLGKTHLLAAQIRPSQPSAP